MKVIGHKKGTPLQDGPLIMKASDLATFADYPENSDALRKLNKRLKLFRGEDGWFATGSNGQVWEYGAAKLGFTAKTSQMITIAMEAGFVPKQRGDQEANFFCEWNDENVERLVNLLKLRVRRASIPVQTRSTAHLFKKKTGSDSGNGV